MSAFSRYFYRLFSALAGQDYPAPAGDSSAGDAQLRSRIASLEMDLREREQRIQTMQKEYELLDGDKQRAISDSSQQQLEKLLKKLTGPLSNAAMLSTAVQGGQQVDVKDLIVLFNDIEKELARFGLQKMGVPGEHTTFDTAIHQRLSGSSVSAGTPVTVRIPGYRLNDRILLKVMVTTREE